ncbi:MAG: hypothetical protein Q7R49_02310 [Candidatus Daviesbacteria bacterium]|nr:hypothetical protein [Candidatus Daviesbacteria bacterium]
MVTKNETEGVYQGTSSDRAFRALLNFVLSNTPEPSVLKRMKPDRKVKFNIGSKRWQMWVENDTRNGNEPVHFVLLDNTEPTVGNRETYGIAMDQDFGRIIGYYSRIDNYQHLTGSDQNISFPAVWEELNQLETERIIRSYRQTHNAERTSELQHVRRDFVLKAIS